MPIHDWTRVDAGLFHDFHQCWTVALCNALNGGLLPKGYSALIERHEPEPVPEALTLRTEQEDLAARGNRLTIRRPLTRVVAAIEIVSPGNKSSRSAVRSFVDKAMTFLRRGTHLLVVDLFPPSTYDSQGLHGAIWNELAEEPFASAPDKTVTLVAYMAGEPTTAYVELTCVGEKLPDMPVFLTADTNVSLPLEMTYQATLARYPDQIRDVIERGEL